MPTYEYACKSCGSHVEVVQSFSDDPLTECESCGGPLRKVFGSIGITFKGSGFYKTDSRSSSSATSAKSKGDGDGGSKSNDTGSKSKDTASSSGSGGSGESSGSSAKPAESATA